MVYFLSFIIRPDFLTEPERMLFAGVIIAGAVQLLKLFVPFLNGWGGVFANAVITAVALFVVFRFELTWGMLALYFAVGLIAAGIHGTATKISDYPSPRENPTPSGTPAQNFNRVDEL
jgi:uncharacterized membrane protein HdeD (DUF308 family)